MIKPFLKCNIWSVPATNQPYYHLNFYLVGQIYNYDSLNSGIIEFDEHSIQIPEFEILDIHLIDDLNFTLINDNHIPILYRDNDCWKIDLTLYENYKLQSDNILAD